MSHSSNRHPSQIDPSQLDLVVGGAGVPQTSTDDDYEPTPCADPRNQQLGPTPLPSPSPFRGI